MSETMTEKPSAGRVTEAMIDRAVQKSGWFVEPHVAPGSSATEDDLSEAEAAQLNKEMRDELRGILESALSAEEAVAITLGDEDARIRIRESLGTRDEARAQELVALLEERTWKRHNYGDEAVRAFEEAAESYMKQGGEGRFLERPIRYFRGRVVGTINAGDVREAAIKLYPNATAATRNRQAIVPIRAVLMHAHDRGWRGAIKIKQFEVTKSRKHKPVDKAWLDAFLAESDKNLPHLSALVLFMHDTGTRISEALRLTGEHVDLGERVAVLERTKTDEWSVRNLTTELVARIAALGVSDDEPVFLYTNARAVNRAMARVCGRAGIEPRTTHSAGRHSFGTNSVAAGGAIKDVMDAGGWKSAKLFLETYVHSSKAGQTVADLIDRQRGPIDILKSPTTIKRRSSFGKR